jgi:hypothetical protein
VAWKPKEMVQNGHRALVGSGMGMSKMYSESWYDLGRARGNVGPPHFGPLGQNLHLGEGGAKTIIDGAKWTPSASGEWYGDVENV